MYLIDTSALVQAQNLYYADDIALAFWSKLTRLHAQGEMTCIDRVKDEIDQFFDPADPLRAWAGLDEMAGAFPTTGTAPVVAAYQQMIAWVAGQPRFLPAALTEVAAGADGWVVAYAGVYNHTVVSMETSALRSTRHAKMPDVCEAFGVEHLDTFAFMRRAGVRFA